MLQRDAATAAAMPRNLFYWFAPFDLKNSFPLPARLL
jgi:hypothetical protein